MILDMANRHRKTIFRRCITARLAEWEMLKVIALERGFKSRNAMIVATLNDIIADYNSQKKSGDSA
jgi:hypothetical protein